MGGFIPWRRIDLQLNSRRSIWISTTRPDGRPHTMPVWFWWDGLHLYFVTAKSSQKAKNLAHQSCVIVHVGDGDDVIILEGYAAIVSNAKEQQRVDAAYQEKYVDPHSGTRATIFNDGDDLYRVDVARVMAWEYGVIATRTDWQFALE
jgi:nitroimidazol reductase NimA-like FMN-containing flavoprotein (pyridoxamine 5'-phosphate oxidase superfamily)